MEEIRELMDLINPEVVKRNDMIREERNLFDAIYDKIMLYLGVRNSLLEKIEESMSSFPFGMRDGSINSLIDELTVIIENKLRNNKKNYSFRIRRR